MKRIDAQDLYAVTDEGGLRGAVEHVEQRMKNAALPKLTSPVAYLKDALKKNYTGAVANEVEPKPPQPSTQEKLERLREEWRHQKAMQARDEFASKPEAERHRLAERFESERLTELPSPIAKAWKKDGVQSKIASSSFFRWLASELWPGEVSDSELLEFATSRS